MKETCFEHKNKIQRICLNSECSQRALCLLCDHPHGNPFKSIMVKTSESYKTFQATINKEIDLYILEKDDSSENKVLQEQILLIKRYFADLKKQVEQFISVMERETLNKLMSDDDECFKVIKRARINKNYVNVPKNIFKILIQIYEGTPFHEVFKNTESGNTEQSYHLSLKLHNSFKEMMEERNHTLKVKMPDVREFILREDNQKLAGEVDYDLEMNKPKYEAKLVKESEIDFDSIISDCQRIQDDFITISYDKKIRIISKSLEMKAERQYNNILTKIHSIGGEVYAIGQSKEILIQNIKFEKEELQVESILKLRGHSQKINDIKSLNSRIVGSSSSEGVKLWDLYKEKCEYTLRDSANPTVIHFIPESNTLAVGYNNHYVKLYSIETMKVIKKYDLPSVPLLIDRGKFSMNQFYLGGFPSLLGIVDVRLNKLASEFNLKGGAITCIADSIYDQNVVASGDRDGNCNLFDLRTKMSRLSWQAHPAKTSISKPRGVINIFESAEDGWTTIGCNDKAAKIWTIENISPEF